MVDTSYGEPTAGVRPPATGSMVKEATLPAVPSVGLAANTYRPLQSTTTLVPFAVVTLPVLLLFVTMQFCTGAVGSVWTLTV